MNATEIAEEAVQSPAQERKKVIARLVMANLRDDSVAWQELQRRMDDRDPANWVALEDLKSLLTREED